MNPQEKACERWLPIHTVTSIALSVISMLADPNDESPANVDAAKLCVHNLQLETIFRILKRAQCTLTE